VIKARQRGRESDGEEARPRRSGGEGARTRGEVLRGMETLREWEG
jgi:hypothetical protein